MRESPVELVARAQEGDATAFERLLHVNFHAAHAVALGVTGEPADAEDVCQDAFVRAWERIGQCRDPARFRGWLLSVVRSVALNRLARGGRRTVVPLNPDVPFAGPSPERGALLGELRDRLLAAVRTLSEGQRTVLLLHDLEGFRHKEIAQVMGISEAMSRRHLSDARARMRGQLADLRSWSPR